MFAACCCAADEEKEGAAVIVDALPVVNDTTVDEQGLVGIGGQAYKAEEELPPNSDDVMRITVMMGDNEDAGTFFDSSGKTSIHLAVQPPAQSAFGKGDSTSSGVSKGDYIVSVNGISGHTGQMIHEALSQRRLDVQVSKPLIFKAAVDKTRLTLGCVINYDLDIGTSVLIGEIREGAVSVWNAANPGKEVKAHDRIIAVDSKPGSGADLLERIKTSNGPLELTVSRPRWLPSRH